MDVIREGEKYGGNVVIHQEGEDRFVFPRWESVDQSQVLTPREVFQTLRMEGYDVNYARVPMTAKLMPGKDDIDDLCSLVAAAPPTTNVVFICHTGVNRSTLGMVLTCILHHWRGQLTPSASMELDIATAVGYAQDPTTSSALFVGAPTGVEQVEKLGAEEDLTAPSLTHSNSGSGSFHRQHRMDSRMDEAAMMASLRYRQGLYDVVQQLMVVCQDGERKKAIAAYYVRSCGQFLDCIEDIFNRRMKAHTARSSDRVQLNVTRAGRALEKYFLILVFNEYLSDLAAVSASDGQSSNPELQALLDPQSDISAPLVGLDLSMPREAAVVSTFVGNSLSLLVQRVPFSKWLTLRPDIQGMMKKISRNHSECLGLGRDGEVIPGRNGAVLSNGS
jgi:hypothetical protein